MAIASDHSPSEGTGRNTQISQGNSLAPGEGNVSPASGRADWNAGFEIDAGSGFRSVGTPRHKERTARSAPFITRLPGGNPHAFAKKTQRTSPLEISLAKKRLKELLDAYN